VGVTRWSRSYVWDVRGPVSLSGPFWLVQGVILVVTLLLLLGVPGVGSAAASVPRAEAKDGSPRIEGTAVDCIPTVPPSVTRTVDVAIQRFPCTRATFACRYADEWPYFTITVNHQG